MSQNELRVMEANQTLGMRHLLNMRSAITLYRVSHTRTDNLFVWNNVAVTGLTHILQRGFVSPGLYCWYIHMLLDKMPEVVEFWEEQFEMPIPTRPAKEFETAENWLNFQE